jgi:hypothetical protein
MLRARPNLSERLNAMTMPEEVKPCNITMTIEVTRPDGPVTPADITASVCHIYEALGKGASFGCGDAHDGSEYRFQVGDVEGLAANRALREFNHRMHVENERLRKAVKRAADELTEAYRKTPAGIPGAKYDPTIRELRALL